MCIIEKSLRIALDAYRGQKDKAGNQYILHPLRIMEKMSTDIEKSAAILHDVIEDSDLTADDLINAGIPAAGVEAVTALTKEDGEDYDDFIQRVKLNDLARKIKIADIEDNINVLRLGELKDKDLQRVAKYHRSWHALQNGK